MSKITFAVDAWEQYTFWLYLQDIKTIKKINTLLKEIQTTPYKGKGRPEPIFDGHWSRRINTKDRLVYDVIGDEIVVLQCKGYYSAK